MLLENKAAEFESWIDAIVTLELAHELGCDLKAVSLRIAKRIPYPRIKQLCASVNPIVSVKFMRAQQLQAFGGVVRTGIN